MKKKQAVLLSYLCLTLSVGLFAPLQVGAQDLDADAFREWNNQVRRDKFDILLPKIMRERGIDMWIHVMREAIPDPFGAEELGSTSGVFVFTDRGDGRIERAVLGRRWGDSQRERGSGSTVVEDSGAYDIVAKPVPVREPVGGPMSEYDFRFEGLAAFVEARGPKTIALNFKQHLGPWVAYRGELDGLSYTDYLLLTKEIGDKYAERIVSSEYLILDYITQKVPSEIELIKKIAEEDVARIIEEFKNIVPGVTGVRDTPLTTFRRMDTGQSQRGRSAGWEDAVIQGGDIVCSPERGVHAYVLREGETEPPPEIQQLYDQYLEVEAILAKNIRAGLTPREIVKNYTQNLEDADFVLRDNQLHMVVPKNDYPEYAKGFDLNKTHLSIDAHSMMKGARNAREIENYFGPRVGSLGPDWTRDMVLPPNHHFVMEYFFYMPSSTDNRGGREFFDDGRDQYLLFWNHEEAMTTEKGVEYLTPPQKELYLIK